MRILFTISNLSGFGGTQTYMYTLAQELIGRGHEVYCWSPLFGKRLASYMTAIGVKLNDRLPDVPAPDVIHAQHYLETIQAALRFPRTPLVHTSHGVIPWQEHPPKALQNCRYVAVSEECQRLLHIPWAQTSRIIRNGINLERFKPARRASLAKPAVTMISSSYMPISMRAQLRRVARKLKTRLIEPDGTLWEVEQWLESSDLVIGLGRSALEGMAMCRPVLVYDYNGGDGRVTSDNFLELREKNFSGRTYRRFYSDRELEELMRGSPAARAHLPTDWVNAEHNIRDTAGEYLEEYERAINEPQVEQDPALISSELADELQKAQELRYNATVELRGITESRAWKWVTKARNLRARLVRGMPYLNHHV